MSSAGTLLAEVTLSESGCAFSRTVSIPQGAGVEEFKRRAEEAFGQRLQLSYEKRVRRRGLGPAPASGGTQLSREVLELLAKSRLPRTSRHVIALTDKTWQAFLATASEKTGLRCRAWTVFQGGSLLSSVSPQPRDPLGRSEALPQGADGSPGPRVKRIEVLKKKLASMTAQQHRVERQAMPSGKSSPDLFRTLTRGQADQTVTRLWEHAAMRNAKRLEEDREEASRLAAKMRLPPRRTERSAADEAMVEQLLEGPIMKRQQMEEDLEAKYEERSPQPRGIAQLTPQEMSEAVTRLYSASEVIQRKHDEARKRVYGEAVQEKKLSKEGLATRIESLYDKAITRKKDKISRIAEEHCPPAVVSKRLTAKQIQEMSERLASKS